MSLVDDIKAFCVDNYEAGYDACVECWDTADYQEWIHDYKVTSVEGFAKSYQFMIDHANDIRSTAF
jgi:phage terminase large subunit-like protein